MNKEIINNIAKSIIKSNLSIVNIPRVKIIEILIRNGIPKLELENAYNELCDLYAVLTNPGKLKSNIKAPEPAKIIEVKKTNNEVKPRKDLFGPIIKIT